MFLLKLLLLLLFCSALSLHLAKIRNQLKLLLDPAEAEDDMSVDDEITNVSHKSSQQSADRCGQVCFLPRQHSSLPRAESCIEVIIRSRGEKGKLATSGLNLI